MMEKGFFVRRYLEPLLKAADRSITGVVYQNSKLNGEYVHVHINDEAVLHIDITSDSPLQIAKDVLKKIEV